MISKFKNNRKLSTTKRYTIKNLECHILEADTESPVSTHDGK